jgi:hypothetical protein
VVVHHILIQFAHDTLQTNHRHFARREVNVAGFDFFHHAKEVVDVLNFLGACGLCRDRRTGCSTIGCSAASIADVGRDALGGVVVRRNVG